MAWVKGESGNPTGKRKAAGKPPWAGLAAMRKVLTRPAAEDKTPGELRLRQMLADDPDKFLARYNQAEKAFADSKRARGQADRRQGQGQGANAGAGVAGAPSDDPVVSLIDRLLAEYEAGEAK